jgi:hypothetical protein
MADQPTPGTSGANPAAEGTTGDQKQPTPGSGDEKVTLTKAELDARMAEIRRGVESSISKKYADYDDLKAKAAKVEEFENANKSEMEKLQDSLKQKDEALRDLPSTIRRQTLKFVSAAAQKGFIDAEDAFLHVGDVDLDDDKAVASALEDLAKRKPHLIRGGLRGDGGGGPRGPAGTSDDMNTRLRAAAGRA